MPPIADIAVPAITRRVGAAWFVLPLVLMAVWMLAAPHHQPATARQTHAIVAGMPR
jgi:hypothetical protein